MIVRGTQQQNVQSRVNKLNYTEKFAFLNIINYYINYNAGSNAAGYNAAISGNTFGVVFA